MKFDLIGYVDNCEMLGIKMNQKKMSIISGVNRYWINVAYNSTETNGIIDIPPDKAYKLYMEHPDAVENFPEDFRDYTALSLLITMSVYGLDKRTTAEKAGMSIFTLNRDIVKSKRYFIYDQKEELDRVFEEMYLPYICNKGVLKRDMNTERTLYFDKKKERSVPPEYQTLENVRANIAVRSTSLRSFLKENPLPQDVISVIKGKKKDEEVIRDLCSMFEPFYVPISVSDAKKRRIYKRFTK